MKNFQQNLEKINNTADKILINIYEKYLAVLALSWIVAMFLIAFVLILGLIKTFFPF